MSHLPLAILGNKVDRPDALGEEELAEGLGLPDQVKCRVTVSCGDYVPRRRPAD